ncbi:MAG TPA: hypothetical protein VHP32_10870 [Ignavibacteria bacterium]|nr:hypothetical protein [Ignavibacteria bacterium]
MGKVIFEINYSIIPEKRSDYMGIINDLKDINEQCGISYSAFENKKNSNNFSEIYFCNSEEDFDSLEDRQDEKVLELNDKINNLVKDKKITYSTKYEL